MKRLVLIIFVFLLGFFIRDLSQKFVSPISTEAAEMSVYDFMKNPNFQTAVQRVVFKLFDNLEFQRAIKQIISSDCTTDGKNISCSIYRKR